MATLIDGIDVSNHQGTIDWDVVASHVTFAIIKASQGTYYTDIQFARNWAEAKRVGVIRGAYLYWDPTVDAIGQVQRFFQVVGKWQNGDLPPALDVEKDGWAFDGSSLTPAQLVAHALTCLQELERLTGKRPMVYTYPDFYRRQMANSAALKDYPLWIAGYPNRPRPMIGGWTNDGWAIHQYADDGWIGPMKVDLDRWNGTLDQLKEFCGVSMNPPSNDPCDNYPQTGFSVCHGFRDYFNANGGVAHFGYPLTGEQAEKLEDGQVYTVQYFERARLEWHDKGPAPAHVEEGRIGAELLALKGDK